jgi:hypothetical protein
MLLRPRLVTLVVAISLTFLLVPAAFGASTYAGYASHATLRPASLPATLLTVNSTGVAGYEGAKSSTSPITYLNASWRQPAVNCTAMNSSVLFDALLSGNTTELVGGTGVKCVGGVPSSFAWYTLGASNSTNVTVISATTLPVPSGSVVRVSIHVGVVATVKITDGTHSISKSHASPGIEYVGEVGVLGMPAAGGIMPLANFGTLSFGASYTHVAGTNDLKVGSVTKGIGAFPFAAKVTMKDTAHKTLCIPTALVGSSTSFKIVWKAAT